MRFGNDMGCTEFEYSNGWLTRFKTRHSISCHSISGESAVVDKRLITDGRKQALDVMKKFCRNIFSVDENSLFYRMDPDKSLTTSSNNKGKKRKKDRITVVLCSNSDGSEKIDVLWKGKQFLLH